MKPIDTEEATLADHLIDKYRESISMRYSYAHLSETFILSPELNEAVVKAVRNYFLDCLYPAADERSRLDEAFDSLRSFVRHPAKTWALVGNMASAIFRFGTQFPQAVKAGVVSLESYVDAKRFEKDLLRAALRNEMTVPLTDAQFERCIADISRKEIEVFTGHILSLFKSMANTKLLNKTILIMEEVLVKIRKNSRLYSEKDAQGIEMGLNILKRGYDLFKDYPESLKNEMLATIRGNERWFLDKVYSQVDATNSNP